MRRIAIVVTARPSYARVQTVLTALQGRAELQLFVAASGVVDRYGDVASLIEADGWAITERLPCLVDSDLPIAAPLTTGLLTHALAYAFQRHRPDLVVTIADRYETLATSIAASYQGLPLCHLQGGEETGNIDNRVRHASTMLADVHCAATREAALRLRAWLPSARVFHTGCPSIDLAAQAQRGGLPGDGLDTGVGRIALDRPFLLVLWHPVTTEPDQAAQQTQVVLQAVSATTLPVLWFWPNPDHGSRAVSKTLREWRETFDNAPIQFVRNLAPITFLQLLARARVVIGNSSVAIREGSYLGTPAVNIGSRQAHRARGPNVIDCAPESERVQAAIQTMLGRPRAPGVTLYGDGTAGYQIAEVLLHVGLS